MNAAIKETPQSGYFRRAAGNTTSVFTKGDLETARDTLVSRFDTALRNDQLEVAHAKAAANGPFCSDGYNASATQETFEDFEYRATATKDSFVAKLNSWLPTVQAITDNQAPYDQWGEILEEVGSISVEADHLNIPTWQGSASDAYRTVQQDHVSQLEALATLADNTRSGLEAVVLIQVALTDSLAGALSGALRTTVSAADTPVSKREYFQGIQDTAWEFTFYTRTAAVVAALNSVIDVANILDGGADWRPAAEQIRTSLDQAAEQARRRDGRDKVDYTEADDVEVVDSQACYLPEEVVGVDSWF